MKLGSIIRFSENGVDGIMPVINECNKFWYCSHGERLPKATWRLATDAELIKARRSLAERSQARKDKKDAFIPLYTGMSSEAKEKGSKTLA